MRRKMLVLLFGAIILTGMANPAIAEVLKVGNICDLTGATSDVGKDYALGMAEAVAYINDTGGINGKSLKIIQMDYGYRIPEAITIYKRFRNLDKVTVLQGWGTGDTEALSPTITRDKMMYFSASYSAHLVAPKDWVDKEGKEHTGTPYNIFFSSDYSSNARGALTVWFEKVWPKHKDFGKRNPRMVCFYQFASPYASAPIKAIKDQAKILGIEVGPDQNVSLVAIDTKSQVLGVRKFNPDVIWHGNTTMSTAAAIRDCYALGLQVNHIINNWGFDENLPRLAQEAAEGTIGIAQCPLYGQDVPLMDKVVAYAKKLNPGVPQEKRLLRTTQAWANALLMAEAMKRADTAGSLDGESILKTGVETMRNWQMELGGIAPLTYTEDDHRPQSAINVYQYSGDKFNLLDRIDLKDRWPEQWANEWMGW
jgi:branched-chain amino acid transport system substrate-binding protein